jgi:hypothetical protein
MPQHTLDFGITDEEYWINPFKSRVQLENQLLDGKQEIVAIGAPARVAVQDRETLPVAVLRTGKVDNIARNPFIRQAVIAAIDLSSDVVYAYKAVVLDMSGPPPYEGPPLRGMSGEAFVIDARRQLGLPWNPGSTFLIHVIMRDRVTNRVRVELKKGGYEDPAVTEYLRQRSLRQQSSVGIYPPSAPPMVDPFQKEIVTIPDYRDRTDSPPIPSEAGIVLQCDRVIEMRRPTSCVVRGSYRLSVQPRHVVPGAVGVPRIDPYTAVVPITLLLTGSDTAVPRLFPLRVPTYDRVDVKGGIVTGYFTVDLCSLKDFIDIPETFFIYAYSGEVLAGPVPMALVR